MVKVGKKIAKHRIAILIIGFLLLIPSAFGYFNTRVNYDILYYLPDNIDTMKGQERRLRNGGSRRYDNQRSDRCKKEN